MKTRFIVEPTPTAPVIKSPSPTKVFIYDGSNLQPNYCAYIFNLVTSILVIWVTTQLNYIRHNRYMASEICNHATLNKMKCPVCGLIEHENLFIPSHGKPLSADDAKSLVCNYARITGCINKTGKVTPDVDSWAKRSEFVGG